MQITLSSDEEMISLGEKIAKSISESKIIELIGDVGSGKTTMTKGIAKGLGVESEITSPSFTISKCYAFSNERFSGNLVHYDFYRLGDPGIMQEDLEENLAAGNTVIIIEWANSVADFLPENHAEVRITINDDGTRLIETSNLELEEA